MSALPADTPLRDPRQRFIDAYLQLSSERDNQEMRVLLQAARASNVEAVLHDWDRVPWHTYSWAEFCTRYRVDSNRFFYAVDVLLDYPTRVPRKLLPGRASGAREHLLLRELALDDGRLVLNEFLDSGA